MVHFKARYIYARWWFGFAAFGTQSAARQLVPSSDASVIPVSGHLVNLAGAGASDELAGRPDGADGVQDSAGRVGFEDPELQKEKKAQNEV